jgi:hypothetical protein
MGRIRLDPAHFVLPDLTEVLVLAGRLHAARQAAQDTETG